MPRSPTLWLLALSCVACESKRITGTVTDSYGKPIAAAELTITGSAYSASTDQNGAFLLDYAPGTFTVQASKPGYTGARSELTIAEKTKYPMAALILRKLPPDTEAAVEGVSDLVPLLAARLDTRSVLQHVNVGGFRAKTTCEESIAPKRVAKVELTDRPLRAFIPRSAGSSLMLLQEHYDRFFSVYARDRTVTCDTSVPKKIPTTVVELQSHFLVEVNSLEPGRYCFLRSPDGALHTAVGYCFRADRLDAVRFRDGEPAADLRPAVQKFVAAARRHDCATLATIAKFPIVVAQDANLDPSMVFTSLGDKIPEKPILVDRGTFERECPTSTLFSKIRTDILVGTTPGVYKTDNGLEVEFPGVFLQTLDPRFRIEADGGGIVWTGIDFEWFEPQGL